MPTAFRLVPLTASLSVGLAVAALAQAVPTGSIRGVVHDSLVAAGPLGGATVELLELHRSITTDARGVFRFDSVPGGRYTLSFFHPSLEAISFTPPDRTVELGAGIDVVVMLATPSPTTIYRLLCTGLREPNTGVLLGTLVDAATGQPLAGAEVRGQWRETTLSKVAGVSRRQRVIRAAADSSGRYRLCGVPTDVPVLIKTVAGGREGAPIELKLEDRAVAVRHFSAVTDTSSRGPGRVTGRVTVAGRGLPDAQVVVIGTDRIGQTGPDGNFTITDVPLGSHTVEARAIGYNHRRAYVDLRTTPAELAFDLSRVPVELPELKVAAASAAAGNGFDERRRQGNGYFMTGADLIRRGIIKVEEAFRVVPGMRVVSAGLDDYRILSTRGGDGLSTECEPTVFIDGNRIPVDPDAGLSLPVMPQDVMGIEVHRGVNSAPMQYQAIGVECGVILIWTKRGHR